MHSEFLSLFTPTWMLGRYICVLNSWDQCAATNDSLDSLLPIWSPGSGVLNSFGSWDETFPFCKCFLFLCSFSPECSLTLQASFSSWILNLPTYRRISKRKKAKLGKWAAHKIMGCPFLKSTETDLYYELLLSQELFKRSQFPSFIILKLSSMDHDSVLEFRHEIDQSEASILVTWSLSANQRPAS